MFRGVLRVFYTSSGPQGSELSEFEPWWLLQFEANVFVLFCLEGWDE